ncbi:MAG: nitrogenase cofactor biosynthesis protein NifB [Treponemataceae bacterium]|nr:nitrogenase cofactor biosynthesis protein NifB [Treponemataceae bacterium]
MNWERHPCFDDRARHMYGRVHVPVAPRCNIQCNYCNRNFDCAHESRPGVSSRIMKPEDTPEYVELLLKRCPSVAVVGIAGPGDPFANPEETLKTLSLLHGAFPDLLLCVATNGLNLAPYIGELANLGVSHVTITINTVDPMIGQYLYAWVRKGKRCLTGYEAAANLIEEQLSCIPSLKKAGILVKINTVLVPGINDAQVGILAQKLASMGADIMNILPLYPVKGTPFAHIKTPSSEMLQEARLLAGAYVNQMHHCTRCRADAAGLLGKDLVLEEIGLVNKDEKEKKDMTALRNKKIVQKTFSSENRGPVRVAIATYEGLMVNQHLGEAPSVLIYRLDPEGWVPEGSRSLPEPGGGESRWLRVRELLQDCHELWVAGIGENPRRILETEGLRVRVLEGLIDPILEQYRQGLPLEYFEARRPHRCGELCKGSGMGCG